MNATYLLTVQEDFLKLWQDLKDFFATHWLNILWFVLALVIGIIIIKIICKVLTKMLSKKLDRIVCNFIVMLLRFCLCMVLVFIVAGLLGINTTGLITVLGAAGLALSLSLQDCLGNVASGMLIASQKPFKEKDYVEVNGVGGQVSRIGVFATEMITFDNKKVIVPNRIVTANPIVNFDYMDTRRVDIKFKASMSCDIDKIREETKKIVCEHKATMQDTFQMVIESLDGGVNIVVRYWVKTSDYWDSLYANNEKIITMLKEMDVALNVAAVRVLPEKK